MNSNSGFFGFRKGGFVALVMVFSLLSSFVPSPFAEESVHPVPNPSGFMTPTLEGPWQFRAALNGWLPTTLKLYTDTPRGGSNSITEDADWLIDNLDYIVPIEGEIRKGSFGVYANLLVFGLDGNTQSGDVGLEWDDAGFLLDVGLSYQLGHWALGKGASLTIEPFAGARLLYDPVDVTIDVGPLEDPETLDISNYVPIIGLRTFWDLNKHWNLRIEGSYGGFGVDDNHETWDFLGVIGYRFRGWGVGWNMQAGWRALRLLDLQKDTADLKIDATGPIVIIACEF